MTLFTPIVDVTHRPYCGPTAIGALTGVPIARIEKMLRRRRNGGRDSIGRKRAIRGTYAWEKRAIRGTYAWEVVRVMRTLGCKVTEMKNPESTFGRFCADTSHINAAFLVNVTGHFMATFKGQFIDTGHMEPTSVEGYRRARRRVQRVWRVVAPAVPKYTINDPIAPPARAAKPKPDIREVRAARIAARIKKWQTRERRAVTALRKLRKQARYYESLTILDTSP